MKFCGIDLHSNNSVVVITDETDRVLVSRRCPNDLTKIIPLLEPHRAELAGVVVESTYNWYWLVDGLKGAGFEVKLANTVAMKRYDGLKHSDDKDDAAFLAHLLRLGILPTGYIHPPQERALRDLARKRIQLVRSRTQHVLAVENIMARQLACRLNSAGVKRLSATSVDRLGLPADVALAMKANVAVIKALNVKIGCLEDRLLLQGARLRPEFPLLKSMPGIGDVLAVVIMLETGNIERFADVGNFASYARCVDSAHYSNGKKKGSGNTKNGNAYLVWAFIEAANFARRFSSDAKRNGMVTPTPREGYALAGFISEAIAMNKVALVGIDLGKHSFHLHGQDGAGRAVFRKKLSRLQMMRLFGNLPACTVVMEACAGAHFTARELNKLGHVAKLISPQFVRPFVKSNKNDFVDAEAICEAACRPSMRYVAPKTEAQQTLSVLHRMRDALVRERTQATNQAHGFLLEFGISLPKGLATMKRLPSTLSEHSLPPQLMQLLMRLHQHFLYLDQQIKELEGQLETQVAEDDLSSRLLSIPGVGPITASLLAVEMGDGRQYASSRDFSASLGLVPRQYSTGGRTNLLGISKRGDKHLRRLLVQCARVYLMRLEHQRGALATWVRGLLIRRHSNVVACALANKLARIAWAIAVKHTRYEAEPDGLTA